MSNSHGENSKKPHGRVLGSSSSHPETSESPSIFPNNSESNIISTYNDDANDETRPLLNQDDETRPFLNPNNETRPFLNPDDPKVTPLNIPMVRNLRTALYILVPLNFILLMFSLISYFIYIPGLNSLGKLFLEFSFIFTSLFVNMMSYLFFLVPQNWYCKTIEKICMGMIAVDFMVVIGSPYMRTHWGFLEYSTLMFTMISISLNMATNKIVNDAKIHEEVRLVGHVETRKTVKEMLILSTETILKLFLFLYLLVISLNIILKAIDTAVAKPWGDLVRPDEDALYRIHLYCQGDVTTSSPDDFLSDDSGKKQRQPIVLLESGHLSSEEFSTWVQELYQLNKIERYCIYDRPGYGFSDSASLLPYSIGINSDVLTNVLIKKNISGPFLVVGDGIGGLYGRVFAARNIHKIDSMLLVDGWSDQLLLLNPFKNSKNLDKVLPREIPKLNKRLGFKLWIAGVFSALNLKLFGNLILHRRRSSERIFGVDMKYQGKYLQNRLQEEVSSSMLLFGDVRLGENVLKDANKQVSVISSKHLIKQSLNWGNWQRELTKLSQNSYNEWVLVDSPYEMWRYEEGKHKLQKLLLRMLGEVDDI